MESRARLLVLSTLLVSTNAAASNGDNAIGLNTHIPATSVVELVADLGAQWIRVDNNWLQQGAPCTESIDFIAPLDNAVDDAVSRGIGVYMTLAYGPTCASTGDSDGNPGNDVPVAAKYQSYVRQSVAHYRARGVTHFGLWNEPNLSSFFTGSPQQYVTNVAIPGIAGIEQGCADAGFSDCKALGPDLAHLGDYDQYLEDVLDAMGASGVQFDILAHHIYQTFDVNIYDGDSYVNALRERRFFFTRRSLVDVLTDTGLAVGGVPTIEVWITETGWRANPPTGASEMALQEDHYQRVIDEQLSLDWYTNTFFYEILDCECEIDGFGIARNDATGGYLLKPAYLALQDRIATEPQLGGQAPPQDPDAGADAGSYEEDAGAPDPDAGTGSEPGSIAGEQNPPAGCRVGGEASSLGVAVLLLLFAVRRRRSGALVWIALLSVQAVACEDAGQSTSVAAAADAANGEVEPLRFCQGPTTLLYDPPASRTIIPDDVFTVDDPTTLTGARLSFASAQDTPKAASQRYYADLETLDGWGITAPILAQLSAPPDPSSLPPEQNVAPSTGDSVLLFEVGEPLTLIPFSWELIEDAPDSPVTNLFISPLVPLQPKTRHALAITSALADENGQCIAPSSTMRSVLDKSTTEPALQRVVGRVDEAALALRELGAITAVGDLSSLTVFTTQHTVEDDLQLSKLIEDMQPVYEFPDDCQPGSGDFLECQGTLRVADFRKQGRAIDGADMTPQSYHDVPIVLYRPTTGSEPFTTIVFGHGLGGTRTDAENLAELFASKGWAIVAADAVKHGDHPDAPPFELSLVPGIVKSIYAFFGLSVPYALEALFDPLAQRDNWRQSQLERLQLIEAIRNGMDADSDGTADVTTEHLYYFGSSMGGIMAAELAALVPELELVISIVPGSRVGGIIRDGMFFDAAMVFLRTKELEGTIHRLFAIWQTIIDRGDSAAFTRHMVQDRLPGMTPAPQTLMLMVEDDGIVPNTTNALYARGLGVPHVGDVIVPIGVIEHQQTLPTHANLPSGLTSGMFQYDLVWVEEGPETDKATHLNISRNALALKQVVHFIESYEDTGVAEIIDPYREFGVKP